MEQNNISIMIKIAGVKLEKIANSELEKYGLTFSQFKILIMLLWVSEGPVRQIDIEERFAMANPTVTGVLNNLVKKGMVKRVPNPDDRRSNIIVPTEKANDMKHALWEIREKLDNAFHQSLTDAEKEQMRVLLRKIINE